MPKPLILFSVLVCCELLFRLPLAALVSSVWSIVAKTVRVARSRRISDHWKEKTLPRYGLAIGLSSIKILLVLLAGILPLAATGLLLAGGFAELVGELARFDVMIYCTVVSLIYSWARVKIV